MLVTVTMIKYFRKRLQGIEISERHDILQVAFGLNELQNGPALIIGVTPDFSTFIFSSVRLTDLNSFTPFVSVNLSTKIRKQLDFIRL